MEYTPGEDETTVYFNNSKGFVLRKWSQDRYFKWDAPLLFEFLGNL